MLTEVAPFAANQSGPPPVLVAEELLAGGIVLAGRHDVGGGDLRVVLFVSRAGAPVRMRARFVTEVLVPGLNPSGTAP